MIEVENPEPYEKCSNKDHWQELILYGRCETCNPKSIEELYDDNSDDDD